MVDLSLHLMDIMQNSIRAEASLVEVGIIAEKSKDLLEMYIKDNGKGMTEEIMGKVTDPFHTSRTTRKVGLGIPLFKDAAEMAGGQLTIQSMPGEGTTVTATFQIDNIDRKPLGDIPDTMAMSIMSYPNLEFHLTLRNDETEYVFRTEDVRAQIGELPINDVVIVNFIRDMLAEQISLLFGGILNEIIS